MSSARNDDGVQCVLCYDALHSHSTRMYCGRLVGRSSYSMPCTVCDGRCGPEGGCQCKSCARLNLEMTRRENIVSVASNPTHVSYNKSAHAEKKGYQFYCGRTIGRGNYANHCVLCEGKCGPRTGCQCVDCRALEVQYQSTKSRDSSPKKSQTGSPGRNLVWSNKDLSTPEAEQSRSSFSGIALTSPLNYSSSDVESDEERALALAFPVDLSAENIVRARSSTASINSIECCENIELRLEEFLHIVRQRKRALINHDPKRLSTFKPCLICRCAPRVFAAVPCGHLTLCERCALREAKQSILCAVCQQPRKNVENCFLRANPEGWNN